ncbi:cellulase family glycosylhydrolase [Nonomuraea sp. NN258]|uniref:cellulase family glycosylhydrolase n=1 Tax=Nonomuraea antri TaxID=2730852 RepID=UPI001569E920|nr:cellulase family glycosylhydrolase [Nonomuraea antri]NRQ34665.1 cellulase family glycosylhydrolase [Nonomuraea antri]
MRIRTRHALAALITLVTLVLPLAPPASAASGTPGFGKLTTADGRTYITDASGRVLNLRGFNAGKWDTDRLREDDVRALAGKGFNLLRLIVQWSEIEPERGKYSREFLGYIDRVLGWADRHGVYVMIDMHQDVFGPAFGHSGAPEWATRTDGLPFDPEPGNWFNGYFTPAVQRAFTHLYDDPDLRAAQVEMWRTLVRTVRGHRSLLGYDLFNEPFGEFKPGEDQVTASARIESTQLSDMYDRLIAAIRPLDRRSWIFVEPTVLVGFGVPTALRQFADDRVGYAPHFYDTNVENTGGDWDRNPQFITGYADAIKIYPTAGRMPVIVGEWGPPNTRTPGNRALVRAQVDTMSTWAAGWAMFYWCRSATGGYCALDQNGEAAPGAEPAFGPYAPSVAGVPVAETYDPATGVYTLRYRPGGGRTTLVSVPFAKYAVGVSGARWHRHGRDGDLLQIVAHGRAAEVVVTVTKR